jgi:hypothetical protein
MDAVRRISRSQRPVGTRSVALALALLLGTSLVSACGSSNSAKSTSTTTTLAVQNIEADQLLARAQLLSLVNFPAGWQASGTITLGSSTDKSTSKAFAETQSPELATCLGVNAQLSVVAAEAASPDFASGTESYIASADDSAFVYATAADAMADFPPFGNPKLADCVIKGHEQEIAAEISGLMPSEVTVGTPVASIGTFSRYGDQSGMIEIGVPLTAPDGSTATMSISFVIIRQGRSIAQLILVGLPMPFSAALARSLAQSVTAKMAATPSSHGV